MLLLGHDVLQSTMALSGPAGLGMSGYYYSRSRKPDLDANGKVIYGTGNK